LIPSSKALVCILVPAMASRASAVDPPEWAVTECQGLKALSEVVYYWIARQNEDGSFGFGLDDDCEFYTAWAVLVYAPDDQRVLESLRKGLDWVWYHDAVQEGYQAEPGDAEHSSEITSYSQPLLTIADYGNPVLIERLMTTSKNMERWTAINSRGHRHFRSHWIGSQGVRDYAYFAADATINARATIPMMHLLWYNRDPDLLRLCVQWCRAWVDHAKETTWGEPYGLLPGEVVFETDEPGGFTKNWWDSASAPTATTSRRAGCERKWSTSSAGRSSRCGSNEVMNTFSTCSRWPGARPGRLVRMQPSARATSLPCPRPRNRE